METGDSAGEQPPRSGLQNESPTLCCVSCKREINDTYYHVSGAVTCSNCAQRRLALQRPPEGWTVFLRAVALSLLAAALGGAVAAWLLASVTVSNAEMLGPVTVSNEGMLIAKKMILTRFDKPALWWCVEFLTPFLAGFLVVGAIRLATRGRSSRIYQVLAVLLTGAAVVLCHVTMTRTLVAAMAAVGNTHHLLSAGNRSPSLSVLIADTLVLPWLILFSEPGHGFIMVVPSAVALAAVWRLTGRDEALIMGPYSLSGGL